MLSLNFVITNILLGVGLAMDTFSVSIVNTLNEPKMPKRKMIVMSLVYASFQAIMPLIGWICVHSIMEQFKVVQPFIPWVALILLLWIGGKMLLEGLGVIKDKDEEGAGGGTGNSSGAGGAVRSTGAPVQAASVLTSKLLIIQGIATSIDALSVGFTIAEYDEISAVIAALIIAAVTFIISMVGANIGKKIGDKLSSKASILGGVILILIGLKVCFF